jgi:hypothetical protein
MILLGTMKRCVYLLDEFCLFFWHDISDRSNFNPLGEFVHSNEDMSIATESGSKRPYGVDAPHGEGPWWGDRAQDLS